jgi:hypothetical protein
VSLVQVELVCKYEEQDYRSQVNIVKVRCVRHIEYSTLGSVGVHFPIDELLPAHHTYKELICITRIILHGPGTLFLVEDLRNNKHGQMISNDSYGEVKEAITCDPKYASLPWKVN